MIVIDLFAGAGGLSEGFTREGYRIVAHVEMNAWACETLRSRILWHYLTSIGKEGLFIDYVKNSTYRNAISLRNILLEKYPEIKQKLYSEVLNRKFGIPKNDTTSTDTNIIIDEIENLLIKENTQTVDVIIGGPPCQAYSMVGRGRLKGKVVKDSRNFLFEYYCKIVNHFKPKMFVFENVPGILTAINGTIMPRIIKAFDAIGYGLRSGISNNDKDNILNAVDFGVCQSRKRIILLGWRRSILGNKFIYPDLKAYSIFNPKSDMVSMDALSDFPPLRAGEGNNRWFGIYASGKPTAYQSLMREKSLGVMNHYARPHIEQDIMNYRDAIIAKCDGKRQINYNDYPEERKTHNNRHSFTDRYKVHGKNELPHTVVAHIAKDGHYNIHYDLAQCRSLTVREAARIQSFPDNYLFEGPRTAQFIQVGNAVPPLMAQAIARAIKPVLNGSGSDGRCI
ncbi:MAG: DNA cytosine methyltransferase [Promethearchaeota archaeon]